jgi:hypothetical protein
MTKKLVVKSCSLLDKLVSDLNIDSDDCDRIEKVEKWFNSKHETELQDFQYISNLARKELKSLL